MTTILQLNTSLNGPNALSSRLASAFVATMRNGRTAAAGDGMARATVLVRDLAVDQVPHLTAERFGAFATPATDRTPEQARAVALSDELIAELERADVIVIGLPMYNFGVPSTLKAYFDHVARAGVTFRYTAGGPEGLLTGKKAYVFATRGGAYAGTPADLQTAYVRQFLGFVGIRDVEFIYAEGLAMGDEHRSRALADVEASIDRLAA